MRAWRLMSGEDHARSLFALDRFVCSCSFGCHFWFHEVLKFFRRHRKSPRKPLALRIEGEPTTTSRTVSPFCRLQSSVLRIDSKRPGVTNGYLGHVR